MTTTEQDKDKGIDEIMKMNIPPDDKAHFIADLAKHRGRCMDKDAITIQEACTIVKRQKQTIARYETEHKALVMRLQNRSPISNLISWLNDWAKS